MSIGYLLPRVKQKTKIIITDHTATFENNRIQNGDEYEIFINHTLVSRGTVKNNEWSN